MRGSTVLVLRGSVIVVLVRGGVGPRSSCGVVGRETDEVDVRRW